MEQIPSFHGLMLGRVFSGFTTNIYYSVFESYLVTEVRNRKYTEDQLENLLCDSTIIANSSSILSGLVAHFLASQYGAVGPFQGAVVITIIALFLIFCCWSENHGTVGDIKSTKPNTIRMYLESAFMTIKRDTLIARIGVIQGLVEGALETFLFLWSPALAMFASSASSGTPGLDKNDEPAYGLIFGMFMTFAVAGSILAPIVRKRLKIIPNPSSTNLKDENLDDTDEKIDPLPVNILCTLIYFVSALLFLTPCLMKKESPLGFSICLLCFLAFQLMVGAYEPLEAMVRSIYIPSGQVCSIVNILRVLTNVFIAVGVYTTTHVSLKYSFGFLSATMALAAILQFTLVSRSDLSKLLTKLHYSSLLYYSFSHCIHIFTVLIGVWLFHSHTDIFVY